MMQQGQPSGMQQGMRPGMQQGTMEPCFTCIGGSMVANAPRPWGMSLSPRSFAPSEAARLETRVERVGDKSHPFDRQADHLHAVQNSPVSEQEILQRLGVL